MTPLLPPTYPALGSPTAPAGPLSIPPFAVRSLLVLLAVSACVAWVLQNLTLGRLLDDGRERAAALAQAFAQAPPAAAETPAWLQREAEARQWAGVRLLDASGRVVVAGVGVEPRVDEPAASVERGAGASRIAYRDRVDAGDGPLENRTLVISRVPVRGGDGAVTGQIETVADITETLAAQRQAQWTAVGLVIALLALGHLLATPLWRRASATASRDGAGPAAATPPSARRALELELAAALQDGGFLLHYQPRVDAMDRRVVAVEALLRWKSRTRGLLPPGEFIDVLEDAGLMPAAGEWVLRAACTQLVRWRDHGRPPLRVSVNVSPAQFRDPGFVDTVQRVLRETGAAAPMIELDLAAAPLLADAVRSRRTLAALRGCGLRLAIGGLGAVTVPKDELRLWSPDVLKIDRRFTAGLAADPQAQATVGSIVTLGASLRIGVVAEGVETEAEAALYAAAGCREMAGFLFCRPLPAEQLARRLTGSDWPTSVT